MSKFKPRTATVPIYQGDWQQRIGLAFGAAAAMRDRVEKAKKEEDRGGSRLMFEVPEHLELELQLTELAKAHDALVAEAVASGDVLEVTLQALPRRRWSELVAAHPPRTDPDVPEHVRKNDAELGINDEALAEELVPQSIIEISDPDLSGADLLEGISSAQFSLLYNTAYTLNRALGADPKAQPRLLPSPSSDATES